MSVFSDIYKKEEKEIMERTASLDFGLYNHFFSRIFDSICRRLTPVGTGDPRMFRRMPEFMFMDWGFGVFQKNGTYHAWRGNGIGGIDEYGYPTRYSLYDAMGSVESGTPANKEELDAGDIVVFKANRVGIAPRNLFHPLLLRICRTMRTIDLVTAKKAISIFQTGDAAVRKALDEIFKDIYTTKPGIVTSSPDIGTLAVKKIDMFGGDTIATSDLWESFRQLAAEIYESAGENSVAFEKKERLNIPEVDANNERTEQGIFGTMKTGMEEGLARCREKWGVDWHLPEQEPEPEPEPEPDNDPDPEPESKEGDDE